MRSTAIQMFVLVATLTGSAHADSHHKMWWDYLVGSWAYEFTDARGEVMLQGNVTYAMAPTGEALVAEWKNDDGTSAFEVAGWEADKKTELITGYASSEVSWRIELHQTTADTRGGPMRGRQRDGTIYSGGIAIQKIDDDRWKWDFTGTTAKGQEHKMHGELTRNRE